MVAAVATGLTGGVLLAVGACARLGDAKSADSLTTESIGLRRRAQELKDSLELAYEASARQKAEKELLVREVHSSDFFMQQLQQELQKIRSLERQAGSLDPKQDPLSSMESERERILGEVRSARIRLARLELAADRQSRQLAALRASLAAAADSALASGSERDSSRLALASVRLLVQDLRGRVDDLQHQVDSLTAYAESLHNENLRLQAAIAAEAARDSTVYYVVGTRRQLVEWKLAREVGGVPVTGWGRVLQLADIKDSSRFVVGHMRNRVIKLDDAHEYQLVSAQNESALETHIAPDGSFRGSLRIRDAEAFWRASKWLVILER